MSKRTRRDELTGRLTEVQRRNRRSLEPLTYTDTTLSLSTGGAGSTCGCPSTCPEEGVNFGPPDARLEWYTDESTGTVVGHVYQDVYLENMGFVPGDDVISYCYSARIGPSTVPIETFCDGKLARLERGLVAAPLTNDLDLWYTSTTEASLSTAITWDGGGSVKVDEATGKTVLWLGYGPDCGWGRVIFYDELPNLNRGLVQFSYGRSGTNTDLTSYVQSPNSNTSDFFEYYERTRQLGTSRLGGGFAGGGTNWGLTRGGNLFINNKYTLGPGGSNVTGFGNPVSVFFNHSGGDTPYLSPRREWVTTKYNDSLIVGGGDPLITVSTSTAIGAGTKKLQFENRATLQFGLLGKLCPDILDVGWATYWDILVMRDEKVTWDLNSSGRVAVLGGGGQKTPYPASTSDNMTYSHNIWRGWASFSTGAPLGGSWGAPYPQQGVKIYDTSTLGTPILNCTEPLIYGGDVFAYSSAGFTVSTGGSTCCQTYVKLNFIDIDGTILSTLGSTGGTNKYAEQRVTGIENRLIPHDAVTARFTQVKTGACSCFGWADDLMFSEGPCCMHYSPPIIVAIQSGLTAVSSTDGLISVIPAATSITAVYSTSNSTFVTGDELYDAVAELGRVNLNVQTDGHDEICVTKATGDVTGTPYPDVVFSDLGMSTADTLSFRWKVKVST